MKNRLSTRPHACFTVVHNRIAKLRLCQRRQPEKRGSHRSWQHKRHNDTRASWSVSFNFQQRKIRIIIFLQKEMSAHWGAENVTIRPW